MFACSNPRPPSAPLRELKTASEPIADKVRILDLNGGIYFE